MYSSIPTYKFTGGIVIVLLLLAVNIGRAQDRDTTKTELHLRSKPSSSLKMNVHSERSVNSLSLPSSGIYNIPEQTQYYQPPFKGQHYLDLAVEAYRKEQKDKLGLNWLFNFMNMMAPYVSNQFEFGVYQIEDLPIVDRDNPLFQSNQ